MQFRSGIAIALTVMIGSAFGSVPGAGAAGAPKPTVTSLKSSVSTLPSAGGRVNVSAMVTNASTCSFSANKPVTGLPVTVSCGAGTAYASFTVPADQGKKAIVYKVTLSATGAGTKKSSASLVTVTPGGITRISASGDSTFAYLPGGSVTCWGCGVSGPIASAKALSTSRSAPSRQGGTGLSGVADVQTNTINYTCALMVVGTVECWGSNQYGQLGNGTTTDSSVPVVVSGLSGVTAIAVDLASTCALLSTGTVECWGSNQYGQLGNGTTVSSSVPVSVSGLTGATALARGIWKTCALLGGGSVDCWGYNGAGDLGNGSTTNSSVPVAVSGLAGATSISVGTDHTCALVANGTVACWGSNADGQLGDGSFTNSSIPVAVSGLSGVVAVQGGEFHTCALLGDGGIDCWGGNYDGQLGSGSTTASPVAAPVTGITNAIAIAIGLMHSCALRASGDLMCWGDNSRGQLGVWPGIKSLVPVDASLSTAPPAQLAFWTTPSVVTDGSSFPVQPQVAVEDAGGSLVSASTTVTLASDPPGLTCTASGLSVSVVNGIATFGGCEYSGPATSFVLVATTASPAVLITTSAPVVFTGPPAQLVITKLYSTLVKIAYLNYGIGIVFGGTQIAIEDAQGNIVDSDETVTMVGTSACTGSGLSVSAVHGIATFSGCQQVSTFPTLNNPPTFDIVAETSPPSSLYVDSGPIPVPFP